jgi:hypothetical protein
MVQPIGDMAPGLALAAFDRRRLQRSACLKTAELVGDELLFCLMVRVWPAI